MKENLVKYILQYADNNLILGHRLGEWCGYGPVLEQDIAMTNISLDLIGLARNYYQYVAEIEGEGKNEDFYPYQRTERSFLNAVLVELPNRDFGYTIVRQFLYDSFHLPFLRTLQNSRDERLAAIARKSFKEVSYHLRYSADWMRRLGDGTQESHRRIQNALTDYFPYSEELIMPSAYDEEMVHFGIGVDLAQIREETKLIRTKVITEATLTIPDIKYWQKGGKGGVHSEYLGKILAEMQYLQRTYPGATW